MRRIRNAALASSLAAKLVVHKWIATGQKCLGIRVSNHNFLETG